MIDRPNEATSVIACWSGTTVRPAALGRARATDVAVIWVGTGMRYGNCQRVSGRMA
jgi:hypothetical protein